MKPGLQELRKLCPDVPIEAVENHLKLLPERYFDGRDIDDVSRHLNELHLLNEDHPVRLLFEAHDKLLTCTIFSTDSPSLLSLLTGTLAAMGMHIYRGDVFVADRPEHRASRRRPHISAGERLVVNYDQRRKVVANFVGSLDPSISREHWPDELNDHLNHMGKMLMQGQLDLARQYVNERVVERLHYMDFSRPQSMSPIEMDFEPGRDDVTRMVVTAEDMPFFLYSMSMAMSLRGMSIEYIEVSTQGSRVVDTIEFTGLHGQPITDEKLLNDIRLTVLFTQHFTYSLHFAPDPYHAICRFEQFMEDVMAFPDKDQWLAKLAESDKLGDLAHLLGASDFMWEDFIRNQYEMLLPVLEQDATRQSYFDGETLHERLNEVLKEVSSYEEKKKALNDFKDRELFLIDLNNILHGSENAARIMAENINILAEAVIQQAADLVMKHLSEQYGTPRTVGQVPAQFAILGLGKCGGVALGYASDIELLFVYSDAGKTDGGRVITNAQYFDYFVREFTAFISSKREGIFDIDLRLRPYGKDGPLASSLLAFSEYFGPGGEALPYLRLALVRLRFLAGDREFGELIERLRDEYIYHTQTIDFEGIRDIRRKQHREKAEGNRVNAKYSRGALVDLEYDVQMLQVMYADQHSELKTPRIHLALERLAEAGVISKEESDRLNKAYYFFRSLTNGLRMLRGSARDLYLPEPDSAEFAHLARRMGYQNQERLSPARQLYLDFESYTAGVRSFMKSHFGSDSIPGRKGGNIVDLLLGDPEEDFIRSIMSAKGFEEPLTAFKNFALLYKKSEGQQRFLRLAVLACDFLKNTPDPDMALNNWERFVGALIRTQQHFDVLATQPKRLQILLNIFSSSQFLADMLINNPEFFDWVTEDQQLDSPLDLVQWIQILRDASQRCLERDDWLDELRRLRRREMLRIAARDTCLGRPIHNVVGELSDLAEGVLTVALERIWDGFEEEAEERMHILELRVCLSIVAYGKLGGKELNYSSDIDVVGIYTGKYHPLYSAALKRLCMDLTVHTSEGHAYRVDLRLRPYGQQGAVVSHIDQFVDYHRTSARLWELQALLKARPVAGNHEIGRSALAELEPLFFEERSAQAVADSIDTLRNQMIQIAGKSLGGTVDVKNGMGGIRDIEFLVQGLQLIHAHSVPGLLTGNTIDAMRRLHASGLLGTEDAAILGEHYIYLRRVEHFLQLLHDRQVHNLPSDENSLRALSRRVEGATASLDQFTEGLAARMAAVREIYLRGLQLEASES